MTLDRSLAQKLDRLLGGSQGDFNRQLPRHIRVGRQSLRSEGLSAKARGILVGVHLVFHPKVSQIPQAL
jgi:hypothetical protein